MNEHPSALYMLVDKWSGPAGFMVLLGAIVWGIQLNIGHVNHSEELATQREQIARNSVALAEMSKNALRTALILEQLERDHRRVEQQVINHNVESEEWKRKILLLEQQNGG